MAWITVQHFLSRESILPMPEMKLQEPRAPTDRALHVGKIVQGRNDGGQIKVMIDQIIENRSKGNALLVSTTQTKLILKGFDPAKYDASSPDDPAVIARLRQVAADLNVTL